MGFVLGRGRRSKKQERPGKVKVITLQFSIDLQNPCRQMDIVGLKPKRDGSTVLLSGFGESKLTL